MARLTDAGEALITTFGRVLEVSSTLGGQLGRSMEQRCGIPHTWFEVLLRISRAEGGRISMGSLAQQVALTTGGITRLLDRMIAAGLVERVPSPSDRRVHLAALTGPGRAALDDAAHVHAANLQQAFAGFSAEDLRTFDHLLDRLRTARIEDTPDPPAAPSGEAHQS